MKLLVIIVQTAHSSDKQRRGDSSSRLSWLLCGYNQPMPGDAFMRRSVTQFVHGSTLFYAVQCDADWPRLHDVPWLRLVEAGCKLVDSRLTIRLRLHRVRRKKKNDSPARAVVSLRLFYIKLFSNSTIFSWLSFPELSIVSIIV